MSPTRRWSRRALLSAAATGVAAVAGCTGSDSPGVETITTTSDGTTTETTRERTTTTSERSTTTDTQTTTDSRTTTTTTAVDRTLDIPFRETPERTLHLDLYRPPDAGDSPFVVFAHGGAWIGGDKGHRPMFDRLVADGYVVADVQYRLAQERQYPAAVQDVLAAVKWLRANADTHGVDPDRGALAGYSAGANLAALVALAPDHEVFQPPEFHPDVSATVDALVGYSGPYDLTTDGLGGNPIVATFLGSDADERRREESSPITHVETDSPPALLLHGSADGVVPHRSTEKLATAYREANASVDVFTAEGAGHGMIDNDSWHEETLSTQQAFLDSHLTSTTADG